MRAPRLPALTVDEARQVALRFAFHLGRETTPEIVAEIDNIIVEVILEALKKFPGDPGAPPPSYAGGGWVDA